MLAREWGHVERVPRIRLEREPEGWLRFLTEEEIARLLTACGESKHPELGSRDPQRTALLRRQPR